MDGRIESWLEDLGLGQYAETFLRNDVDLRALPHLTKADLRELGISLGHCKVILAAIRGFGGQSTAGAEADARRAGDGGHLPV
jgi:hypothetical protein